MLQRDQIKINILFGVVKMYFKIFCLMLQHDQIKINILFGVVKINSKYFGINLTHKRMRLISPSYFSYVLFESSF
jgi:hypothetical protein